MQKVRITLKVESLKALAKYRKITFNHSQLSCPIELVLADDLVLDMLEQKTLMSDLMKQEPKDMN